MKKLLLLLFFAGILKVAAQENQVEISLSAGPIVSNIWKTTEFGAGFKGNLGYKFGENFTVLAGVEYTSLPISPNNIRPYYPNNTSNDNKIDYINVEGKRATVISGNVGFKINIFSTGNIKPYLTVGLGLASFSQTKLNYDEEFQVNIPRSIGGVPPYQAFYGFGLDFKINPNDAFFLEISQNGFVFEEEDVAFYTIPIRAGLKMWF